MTASAAGGPAVYRITHRTVYRYDAQVGASFGRAHLLPADRDGQACRSARIEISPAPAELREHVDYFGNRSTYFALDTPHRELAVLAESTVAVSRAPAPDRTPRWEDVRDGLAVLPPARRLEAGEFALPSPRLPPDPAVTAYARPSFAAGRSLAEAALDLTGRIHRDFRYAAGATTVGSSVADLLAAGEGVCQDFAHLAVAALRAVGLPARYVSGYLETTPPPGAQRLRGADASHAWVSVFAGAGWLDLDPTNDRLVGSSYVELARGRDYADVPPLTGVIFTDATASPPLVAVDMLRHEPGSPAAGGEERDDGLPRRRRRR